jgi:ribosomal-protein-alanine N-acetyltransferase
MTLVPDSHEMLGSLIKLRTPNSQDYQALKNILNDPVTMEALRSFFGNALWTNEMVEERYTKSKKAQKIGRALRYVVVDQGSNNVIGDCGLKDINSIEKKAEYGIILHQSFWGTAAAKECMVLCFNFAFESLGLQTIYFTADEQNLRVIHFCNKLGVKAKSKSEKSYLYFEIKNTGWEKIKKILADR